MTDLDADVIALSPKTGVAANRFVCEVCKKGFSMERRTCSSTEEDTVCPELGCVHHNSSRALGDLTDIKKYFSRKHGEKKYSCYKGNKKYAVHSDWKAHNYSVAQTITKVAHEEVPSLFDDYTTNLSLV